MPCDIGYKSYSRVNIPAPQVKKFKNKTEAPKIDAELLEKIGENDPEFLEWLLELDIIPLLKEALKRALLKVGELSKNAKFSISKNGDLMSSARYDSETQKRKIEEAAALISNQFQAETLAIVAELLDYEISVSKSREGFVIDGEKEIENGISKVLKITIQETSSVRFEHFESKKSIEEEERKFLGLAQKLGVKMKFLKTERSGQPIQGKISDDNSLRGK